MPIAVATVRDLQSAEYLKTLALGEADGARALPLWRAACDFDPDSSTLVTHLGHGLLDARMHGEAIDVLLPGLLRWPRHVHLANLLGVTLFELGHTRDAMQLFQHGLTLDPEYPAAKPSLANARKLVKKSRPAPRRVRVGIEQVVAAAASSRRPTLSTCMIAKDEAEFIVGAIESVAGLADEVVVVDTGSSDDTVELARGAGARVEYFPWNGSFSDARNASIELATGDWILVLDCDERVNPKTRTSVRSVMEEEDDGLRVVCPTIKNYTRDGRYLNDGFSGRLFRNRPEMRFKGRVHEEVGRGHPDVTTDYRLDIVLDHYGADPDVMREKSKDGRNIALLESRLAEAPDDLLTWFYLGSQHWLGQRMDEAREAFGRVVELFERNPSAYGMTVKNLPVPYSYVGLVRGLVENEEPRRALEVGNRGLARFPDNPDLWYHTAFAQIAVDDFASARAYAVRARDAHITGYALISMHEASISAWRAAKMVADIDFEQDDARAAYDGYVELLPKITDAEASIVTAARLVELASSLGEIDALAGHTLAYVALKPSAGDVVIQVAQALASHRGLQAAYDLLTEAWVQVEGVREHTDIALSVGNLAEQAGEDAEALRWYEIVAERGNQDARFWATLSQLLVRLGAHDEAAHALRVAEDLVKG